MFRTLLPPFRKANTRTVFLLTVILASLAYAVSQQTTVQINKAALKQFQPLPTLMASAHNTTSDAKVKLGRMLYYEARLSANQDISCNTCHPLDAYGAESEPVSTGHKKQTGARNAPTVYNAAGHFAQFWDGRAPDVEEQAKGPLLNPVEMAMPSDAAAVVVLKSMPEYVALFRTAFPNEADPVTFSNMALAIGAFERGLVTPSRWDRFLKGDDSALSDSEKMGFNKFVDAGCHTCHNGAYVGGMSFQRLGLAKPWPKESDLGRYQLTKEPADRMLFKVPSLRNVTKTAPYFHDGSVPTIETAIRAMGVHQRGTQLSDSDVQLIVVWFNSLTGEVPSEYVKKPPLPQSTVSTPRPRHE